MTEAVPYGRQSGKTPRDPHSRAEPVLLCPHGLVVRCRQKIPAGREPPSAPTAPHPEPTGVPSVGVAPLGRYPHLEETEWSFGGVAATVKGRHTVQLGSRNIEVAVRADVRGVVPDEARVPDDQPQPAVGPLLPDGPALDVHQVDVAYVVHRRAAERHSLVTLLHQRRQPGAGQALVVQCRNGDAKPGGPGDRLVEEVPLVGCQLDVVNLEPGRVARPVDQGPALDDRHDEGMVHRRTRGPRAPAAPLRTSAR